MHLLQSDPRPLLPSQVEELTAFFNGDTYALLRRIARSSIAESSMQLALNTAENAQEALVANALTQEAHEFIQKIARHTIFLDVLESAAKELKEKGTLILTEQINIDQN